jgi:hypothetical protein
MVLQLERFAMQPSTLPNAVAVEVVPVQPTDADRSAIAHLSARDSKLLPQVAYIVKIRFETMPQATSEGWALYVKDFRIPKYWAYKDGIFFKVFDPQFFQDHHGQSLRFSQNGTEFVDTGLKLAIRRSRLEQSASEAAKLPLQDDVLNDKLAKLRPELTTDASGNKARGRSRTAPGRAKRTTKTKGRARRKR